MKFWCADYTLTPARMLNAQTNLTPREGFLLKVEWSPGLYGYSDVFPWPEFGDPSRSELKTQVQDRKSIGSLVAASLFFNREDAKARKVNRCLFSSLVPPECHALLNSADLILDLKSKRELGFSTFKLKMGPNIDFEQFSTHLLAHEKIRLDFNGTLAEAEFFRFWNSLESTIKTHIDLIEDPWKGPCEKSSYSHLPLASDFIQNTRWPHQVVKPTRDVFQLSNSKQRVIFTHSLDHPVGQAFALWFASRFHKDHPHKKEIHGVSPNHPYRSTEFSEFWSESTPRPKAPKGLGVGFDDLLKGQKWISI